MNHRYNTVKTMVFVPEAESRDDYDSSPRAEPQTAADGEYLAGGELLYQIDRDLVKQQRLK